MEIKAIDYVVPMVFHDDAEWQQSFRSTGVRYDEANLESFVRFRSWGTEELLIRCVMKYMPWLRNIYILLAQESQKKEWMNRLSQPDGPQVKIVYHKEFMPQWALPTFNSCSIEMFLHRIPGISERFLYGNDDMFPLSPLSEEDFFVDGLPCQHYSENPFPESPNTFHLSCLNGLNFIGNEFNVHYRNSWLKGGHSITPMLKSTWEHLWERGRREIEVSINRFRSADNFNQWLCPWWHHLAGKYVDKVPKRTYVSTKNTVEDVAKAMSASDVGIVCVNDHECVEDYMRYGKVVMDILITKLS